MTLSSCDGVGKNAPIFIDGLYKQYRSKSGKKVTALGGISLTVYDGEVFGFLGPNGAGKSTTIKSLLGLVKPTSGSVKLYGQSAEAATARKKVGYLPENPTFYDFLTAREYLGFVGRAFSMRPKCIKRQVEKVLSLLEITYAADRPIRGYSKGMVQRLGLAQVLLHEPDLFILDEPMSGLDPLGRALVKDIILDLKQKGKTVFFSTHVTADAERLCDRIGVIVHGRLQDEQLVSDLLDRSVDGYICRLRINDAIIPDRYPVVDCGGGEYELLIARSDFDCVAADLLAGGVTFISIEPRRRDIEDYLLNLVAQIGN